MGYSCLSSTMGSDHVSCDLDQVERGFSKSEVMREKRCVHFGDAVMVFLIPSRREYHDAGLVPVLWWVRSDFIHFKEAALSAQACTMEPSRAQKMELSHSHSNESDMG